MLRWLGTAVLATALVFACGGDDEAAPGGGGSSSGDTPGGGTFVDGFEKSRDAFVPISGKLLAVFGPIVPRPEIDTTNFPGVVATLSADRATLAVELRAADGTTRVEGADLAVDPDHPGGFITKTASMFGIANLTVRARMRKGEELVLSVVEPNGNPKPDIGPATFAMGLAPQTNLNLPRNDAERRRALREHYGSLITRDNLCNDLVRFATFVQDIVDTDVGTFGQTYYVHERIMDDMVNLFVNDADYLEYLMNGEPTNMQQIVDPGPTCVGAPYTGFAAIFKRGEGRFRHFTANMAARRLFFGYSAVVWLAAAAVGGDHPFADDPTGDVAADLATNTIGRDFFDYLDGIRKGGAIADGHSVKDWIIGRFADDAAGALVSSVVVLDRQTGPHAAGERVGLCRVGGCKITNPDACDGVHLHPMGAEGVTIDSAGPYPEPADMPPCGYGRIAPL